MYSFCMQSYQDNKIHSVKYGELFDIVTHLQPLIIAPTNNQPLDLSLVGGLIERNGSTLYSLARDDILNKVETYDHDQLQDELSELIQSDKWITDYWLLGGFDIIVWYCRLMKLSTLNVIASYMIP